MLEEKNKNDFESNQEFLLNPRYKAFISGKSNKLYWSRINNELSIMSILALISGFCGAIFFGFMCWLAWRDAYTFENGIEINATITNCTTYANSDDIWINLEYVIDGTNYTDLNKVFNIGDCSRIIVGTQTPVRYIKPSEPLLAVNARNYSWELVYFFVGVFCLNFLMFVGCSIHELRNLRRFRKLQRNGIIIDGNIQSWAEGNSIPPIIIYFYRFQSPTGKWIEGKRKKYTDGSTPPEFGTPVNILYAGDNCHMLL